MEYVDRASVDRQMQRMQILLVQGILHLDGTLGSTVF
jgi:hypothetical protein